MADQRELVKAIQNIICGVLKNESLSDLVYATYTGKGLKIEGKPIEVDEDMIDVPEHLKKYKVKVSFCLGAAELDSMTDIKAYDSAGGLIRWEKIEFKDVPMLIKYDEMKPGQRYLVSQKRGAQRYGIIDRIPE